MLPSTLVYCPYCGEPIDVFVDPGGDGAQRYIEDCAVCCRPITLQVDFDADGDPRVQAWAEDDVP